MSRNYSHGVVYFVGNSDLGPVKIGFTTDRDVVSRLRQLQTGSHENLTILGTIDGGPAVERAIHTILAPHLVRGEWFERDAAISVLDRIKGRMNLRHKDDFYEKLLCVTDLLTKADGDAPTDSLEVVVVRNLILDKVHELLNINTEALLPFRAWLINQEGRSDPVGDLSSDVARDPSFPAVGNLSDYLTYIVNKRTTASVTSAILDAWIECDIAIAGLQYSTNQAEV